MSAATIDRLLRMPKSTIGKNKPARLVPEPRRRIKVRTFADWNEPHPGSMEMDLVAYCGQVNPGSYVHSLVLTDIASGWTEAAPIVVREMPQVDGLIIDIRQAPVELQRLAYEKRLIPFIPAERSGADASWCRQPSEGKPRR